MPLLLQMRDELEASMPPEGKLSRLYWEAARWQRYKKDLATELGQRKHIPKSTKWKDVPRSIREDYSEYINLVLPAITTESAEPEPE